MKKVNLEDRLNQLLQAAEKVFISRGYRRTTMADIAREMGVAPGTLYLYVESKEALFHLLAMRTLVDPDAQPAELPVRTPPPDATLKLLSEAASLENLVPGLAASLSDTRSRPTVDEVKAVFTEVYDMAYEHRAGINLMESSAYDWPDMADVFYGHVRKQLIEALSRYLERGVAAGVMRDLPDLAVATRFVLETIGWFAIHRHGDRGSAGGFSNEVAQSAVIDLLLASVIK